jgi:hypothetical protein
MAEGGEGFFHHVLGGVAHHGISDTAVEGREGAVHQGGKGIHSVVLLDRGYTSFGSIPRDGNTHRGITRACVFFLNTIWAVRILDKNTLTVQIRHRHILFSDKCLFPMNRRIGIMIYRW